MAGMEGDHFCRGDSFIAVFKCQLVESFENPAFHHIHPFNECIIKPLAGIADHLAVAYHISDGVGGPILGHEVRLAVRDASGWPASPEVITTRPDPGSSTSLAFDTAGNIYVAFGAVYSGNCLENGVEVAFNDGSGWTFDLVTELPSCTPPNVVSLALDPNNFELPSVAIKDGAGGVLKFAWKIQ